MRKSLKNASKTKKRGSKRIKSKYRMRGMGTLLNMYGGATEALEAEFAQLKRDFMELKAKVDSMSVNGSVSRREAMKGKMASAKKKMIATKDKMKAILKNAAKTTAKAASAIKRKSPSPSVASSVNSLDSQSQSTDSLSRPPSVASLRIRASLDKAKEKMRKAGTGISSGYKKAKTNIRSSAKKAKASVSSGIKKTKAGVAAKISASKAKITDIKNKYEDRKDEKAFARLRKRGKIPA
ncbi:hypothetical protein EB118_06095 [bacterium]|nr:hypothetical protein [bacterium]NDC93783.1 hypothetical protein [bacterium]NDD83116.1 hypothetical protein [bacterium]NDG29649.1 hypothetical protein [bacterium]